MADSLRKVKKKGLKPVEVMQRGCLEMFKRLSGASTTRFLYYENEQFVPDHAYPPCGKAPTAI